jgi:methylamine dehydrogenase light chain
MSHRKQDESRLDLVAANFLDHFAQRISRRGVVARIGKLTLGIMGMSLVPSLPLDRTFTVEATGGSGLDCGDWRLCGMCGSFCARRTSCCGGGTGGDMFICPGCTQREQFWFKCCTDPCDPGNRRLINYHDCCGATNASVGCTGDPCEAGCDREVYCASGNAMRCTVIQDMGPC